MRFVLSAVLLAACADTTEAWPPSPSESVWAEAPAEQGPVLPPPGVDLTLEVSDLIPGERASLTAYDADPGETVVFVRTTAGLGNPGACPGALGGACLDINGPAVVAGTATANAQGVATLTFTLPAGAPVGVTAWFEAAAARGVDSVTSNPVEKVLGATAPWSNPIAVDGDGGDWLADESFATTSGGDTATLVTWDANFLYLGLIHPDIQNGGDLHWTVVYLGTGAAGTTTGINHNTQAPDLPFAASHALRRKADGSYDGLLEWDGSTWIETPFWLGTEDSSVAEGGELLELGIPRGILGADQVQIATAFVYEGSGYESTFAGAPADSFVDGYDPDLGSFLAFDLTSSDSPVQQNP